MGGDCLNTGCVPSKALIRAARCWRTCAGPGNSASSASRPGWISPPSWTRVRSVIRQVEPHDSVERYTALGVEVIRGHARLTSPWTVEIAGEGRARAASPPGPSSWPPARRR
jgi:pyruvate/2-oxoglutarate dehydrogenase complex dihydrolipoamide dehydrogenase (E3) component